MASDIRHKMLRQIAGIVGKIGKVDLDIRKDAIASRPRLVSGAGFARVCGEFRGVPAWPSRWTWSGSLPECRSILPR